ncbi:MAG: cupin domain-containing protein [Fimbriimonas sp.]
MSLGNSPLNIFGNTVTVQVSGADSGGKLAVVHDVTPPLGGPPLHKHLTDTEAFYVLEGSFVFELDGVLRTLGVGESITILPGVVHLYQNVGELPGRMLIVTTPAGLDEFFVELDELLKSSAEPDMPAIAALHGRFGMELLGPPLVART